MLLGDIFKKYKESKFSFLKAKIIIMFIRENMRVINEYLTKNNI